MQTLLGHACIAYSSVIGSYTLIIFQTPCTCTLLTNYHYVPPRYALAARVHRRRPLLLDGRHRHPTHIFGDLRATKEESTFYTVVGARNLSLAATVLAFVYTGQQRALGTMMMCYTLMGVVDIGFLLTRPGYSPSKMAIHVVKGAVFPILGGKLLEWY
ncbi:unnamed protein product [Cutaneotrichosporon oleaginosum]